MRETPNRRPLLIAAVFLIAAAILLAIRAATAPDPTKPSAPIQAGQTPVYRAPGEPLPGHTPSLPPLPGKK